VVRKDTMGVRTTQFTRGYGQGKNPASVVAPGRVFNTAYLRNNRLVHPLRREISNKTCKGLKPFGEQFFCLPESLHCCSLMEISSLQNGTYFLCMAHLQHGHQPQSIN